MANISSVTFSKVLKKKFKPPELILPDFQLPLNLHYYFPENIESRLIYDKSICWKKLGEGRFLLHSCATVFSFPLVHWTVHRCGSEGNTFPMPGEHECCTYLSFTNCTHCFRRSGQSFRGVFPNTSTHPLDANSGAAVAVCAVTDCDALEHLEESTALVVAFRLRIRHETTRRVVEPPPTRWRMPTGRWRVASSTIHLPSWLRWRVMRVHASSPSSLSPSYY